jgi:putative methyltransferase (TIGR04325 family)
MYLKFFRFIILRIKHLYRLVRGYGWYGNYPTWNKALEKTKGYSNDSIHLTNLEATKRALNGEGKYVRDGVIFEQSSYDFHILVFMFENCFFNNDKRLNFIDFGGNYASFYLKNKYFIEKFSSIDYRVIELKELVERSDTVVRYFRGLSFHSSLSSALQGFEMGNSMLLMSGVLGYVENYQSVLSNVLQLGFAYIFVDRTLVVSSSRDRICVQRVLSSIVEKSSYPCRIFSEKTLLELFFSHNYHLQHAEVLQEVDDYRFQMKYFVFKRKT